MRAAALAREVTALDAPTKMETRAAQAGADAFEDTSAKAAAAAAKVGELSAAVRVSAARHENLGVLEQATIADAEAAEARAVEAEAAALALRALAVQARLKAADAKTRTADAARDLEWATLAMNQALSPPPASRPQFRIFLITPSLPISVRALHTFPRPRALPPLISSSALPQG